MIMSCRFFVGTFWLIAFASLVHGASDKHSGGVAQISEIIAQIRHADYAGDQRALRQGYDALTPFLRQSDYGAEVSYWRGFARWRQALNGFNDPMTPEEIDRHLGDAIGEFSQIPANASIYREGRIGTLSCLGNLIFLHTAEPEQVKHLIAEAGPISAELSKSAPDNPRRLWVAGPLLWNVPASQGGGQDKAIAGYLRGLHLLRARQATTAVHCNPTGAKPSFS